MRTPWSSPRSSTGRLTGDEIRTVSGFVANRELLYETYLDSLPAAAGQKLDALLARTRHPGPARRGGTSSSPRAPPRTRAIDAGRWEELSKPVRTYLDTGSDTGHTLFEEHVSPDTP